MKIEEISEQEHQKVLNANLKYGYFLKNAVDFNGLIQESIAGTTTAGHIFMAFYSQFYKHHTLSILSAVRLHHTQTMLNLRIVLEAGVDAAYAIEYPYLYKFTKNVEGLLMTPDNLRKKRYKWIEKKYPKHSDSIKGIKDKINSSCAHSSIVYALNSVEFIGGGFNTLYFDKNDDYQEEMDLFIIANIAMALLNLFYEVNAKSNRLTFSGGFMERFKEMSEENERLKEKIRIHPRYIQDQDDTRDDLKSESLDSR